MPLVTSWTPWLCCGTTASILERTWLVGRRPPIWQISMTALDDEGAWVTLQRVGEHNEQMEKRVKLDEFLKDWPNADRRKGAQGTSWLASQPHGGDVAGASNACKRRHRHGDWLRIRKH